MSATRRIILFGAGDAARKAMAALSAGDRIVAIADNSAAKVGTHFCGHPIVAPASLGDIGHDVILVASMYWKEITAQLDKLGHAPAIIEVAEASRAPARPKSDSASGDFADRDAWTLVALDQQTDDYQPLVSVIMPTWNRARILPRAVQSVLAQTYEHFELIIVDDGSTDNSREYLESLSRRDRRIRVIMREHAGVSATRNAGLATARGELIAYLDSDNRWHPDYLRLMTRGFRDPAWSTGYAGINIFDETSGRYRTRIDAFSYERLQRSNHIDLNVFMHRHAVFDDCGGFDESLTRLVDWDLALRYTRHHPPFVLPAMLADYFISADVRRITDTEPYMINHGRMTAASQTAIRKCARAAGPLRIAFVQHEFPALSQTFVQNEIGVLMDLGVQVSAFYVRESSVTGPTPAGLDMVKIASRDHLVHLLQSRHIELVHTHFAMPHLADLIVPVCERLDLPFTQKPHAFDIFRRDHDPRHHIGRSGSHPLCRLVYCEGEYHRKFLAAEGVPAEKLKVVRNIFDLAEFRAPAIRINPQARRIVSISRFVEKKGYHLLIEAVRAIDDPDLRLDLYGYGEEEARLKQLADGDARIAIKKGPGCVEEAVPLFRNADVFALPCIADRHGDTDGLPTVLMEAMAAGVPVLTTPLASIPDLVTHKETGYLVESGSLPSLIAGLRSVLLSSPGERERIAHNAWAHLEREFDPVRNTRSILADWRDILGVPA